MSTAYTAMIERAACFENLSPLCIHTHALHNDHSDPTVLLTFGFGNGQFIAHLSPKDAETLSEHLKNAVKAVADKGASV